VPGRRLLVAFGAWTLFVWATRIGTAAADEAWDRVAMAVGFTLVGVGVLVVAWRARARALTAGELAVLRVAVGFTVVVWLVRGVQIAVGDHGVAFVAVHLVLAVVAIGLGVAALRAITLGDRHGTAGHRRAEVDVTS
jgi:hypothetical protein